MRNHLNGPGAIPWQWKTLVVPHWREIILKPGLKINTLSSIQLQMNLVY